MKNSEKVLEVCAGGYGDGRVGEGSTRSAERLGGDQDRAPSWE